MALGEFRDTSAMHSGHGAILGIRAWRRAKSFTNHTVDPSALTGQHNTSKVGATPVTRPIVPGARPATI